MTATLSMSDLAKLVAEIPPEELDGFIDKLVNTDETISYDTGRKNWRTLPIDAKPIHQSIVDREKYEASMKGELADCWEKSMILYLKLEKIGVKRMRGKRETERKYGGFHYWVESKDVVYEEHGGVRQIYDKETFYTKSHQITEAEQSTINMFFSDEFDLKKKDKIAKKLIRDLLNCEPIALGFRKEIVEGLIQLNKTK